MKNLILLIVFSLIVINPVRAQEHIAEKNCVVANQVINADVTDDQGQTINLDGVEVCKQDREVSVLAQDERPVRHLVYVGMHVGTFLGWDLSYVHLDQDGLMRYRIGLLQDTNLQAVGFGAKFGYHPHNGRFSNKVFYGAEARYYSTPHQKGFMMGPVVGVSGGRKFVTFRAAIGAAGYREGQSYGIAPVLDVGLSIRLFRVRSAATP